MVNVGIVGLGFMAATHIKAYQQVENARIAALCNPSGRHLDGDFSNVTGNIGTGEPVRLDMSGVKAYRAFEEMLANPEIELIDICAPTMAHASLAVAALGAGKHVICEKPLARTSQEAEEIAAAAAAARTFFMPAMCLRFWPEWLWVKEAIEDNRFGRALAGRFRRVAEPPGWGHHHFCDGRLSGGALLDLHIHDVDFVQFCFGPPRSVFASGYTKISGAIDHVVAQYQFDSGTIAHAEGSWAMSPGFGFNMAYTVNFEKATVDYDLVRGAEALKVFEPGEPGRTIRLDGPDGFTRELQYMVDSIQTGRPPAVVTVSDAVRAVAICEAEERSIREGGVVELGGAG